MRGKASARSWYSAVERNDGLQTVPHAVGHLAETFVSLIEHYNTLLILPELLRSRWKLLLLEGKVVAALA